MTTHRRGGIATRAGTGIGIVRQEAGTVIVTVIAAAATGANSCGLHGRKAFDVLIRSKATVDASSFAAGMMVAPTAWSSPTGAVARLSINAQKVL